MKNLTLLTTTFLAMSLTASADIIITEGSSGSGNNIVFNDVVQDATNPLVGRVNGTQFLYGFNSTDTLAEGAQGQARITATDGSFADLNFSSMDGFAFTQAVLNLQLLDQAGQTVSGTVFFNITQLNGPNFQQSFAIDSSGENFFTIDAINGQAITNVAFVTTAQLADVRQVRISGTFDPGGDTPEVPEPLSMGLMGGGLALLGIARKFRK